jgi:hypothetical protein
MPKGVYPAEKNGKPHPAAGKSQNKYYANGELRPQRKSRAKADPNIGKEQIRDKKGGGMYSAIRQRATRKDKGKTKEKVAPKYSTINKPDKYSVAKGKKANVGMIYTAKPTPTQPEFDTDDEADNSFSIPKKIKILEKSFKQKGVEGAERPLMEFKPKAGFVDKNPPKGKSAYGGGSMDFTDERNSWIYSPPNRITSADYSPEGRRAMKTIDTGFPQSSGERDYTGLHEFEGHTDRSGLAEIKEEPKKAKKIKFKVSNKPAKRLYTSGYLGGHALEGGYKANEFATEEEALSVASKHKGKVGGITKRMKRGQTVYGLRKGKQIKSVGTNKSEMSYLFN